MASQPKQTEKKKQICLFNDGLELADLLASSDLIYKCWAAISKTDTALPFCVYEDDRYPSNGTTIAFTSPTNTVQLLQGEGKDLVPSATLKDDFCQFDFICTKVNPSFSINKAVIELYKSLHGQLSQLEIDIKKPLVITGHCLGGSIASLFTLWLLDNVYSKKGKPPICITFGSPLIGDDAFLRAISERPTWTSRFLNVVSTHDPIPKLLVSPNNSRALESSSNSNSCYKPFGTFLFCSESGGSACFEEHELVLGVMVAMSLENVGDVKISEYGRVLNALKKKTICRGISEMDDLNPFREGITLQLVAIGVTTTQQLQQNNEMKSLISLIEKGREKSVKDKRNHYEDTHKLYDSKIDMSYMEWYKKNYEREGGYYDSYKNDYNSQQQDATKHQRKLTNYWKGEVEKAEKMPQKEELNFGTGFLYAGTNYRRMIEPLDIAYHYKKDKDNNITEKDYITEGRSKHYILLEQWLKDDKKARKSGESEERKKNKAASLTEDSCFWAYVEEAFRACKELKDGKISEEKKILLEKRLDEFEDYVMGLIDNFSVSTEIFLKNSSFMQWWSEYDKIKGSSHNSPLSTYMRNPSRRMHPAM